MKVILLKDVAKIGRRHDVVEVPNGYALNMLIPKGLAKAATPENIKQVKAQVAVAGASQAGKDEQFQTTLSLIEYKTIVVSVPANEKGHLFESVKSSSIVGAIGGLGAVVTEDQIRVETPIKEVGEHTIVLEEGDVTKKITVTVEAA